MYNFIYQNLLACAAEVTSLNKEAVTDWPLDPRPTHYSCNTLDSSD